MYEPSFVKATVRFRISDQAKDWTSTSRHAGLGARTFPRDMCIVPCLSTLKAVLGSITVVTGIWRFEDAIRSETR